MITNYESVFPGKNKLEMSKIDFHSSSLVSNAGIDCEKDSGPSFSVNHFLVPTQSKCHKS